MPKHYPRNPAIEDAATMDQLGREAYRLHKRVHDLEVYRQTLTRERDQALAALRALPESLGELSGCENTAGVYACVQHIEQVLLEFPQ